MIEFRDRYTREIGAELIVHQNREALEAGANPFCAGHAEMLRPAEDQITAGCAGEGGFDAAFGGARRDEEKSRAKERIYSFRDRAGAMGPQEPAP